MNIAIDLIVRRLNCGIDKRHLSTGVVGVSRFRQLPLRQRLTQRPPKPWIAAQYSSPIRKTVLHEIPYFEASLRISPLFTRFWLARLSNKSSLICYLKGVASSWYLARRGGAEVTPLAIAFLRVFR